MQAEAPEPKTTNMKNPSSSLLTGSLSLRRCAAEGRQGCDSGRCQPRTQSARARRLASGGRAQAQTHLGRRVRHHATLGDMAGQLLVARDAAVLSGRRADLQSSSHDSQTAVISLPHTLSLSDTWRLRVPPKATLRVQSQVCITLACGAQRSVTCFREPPPLLIPI